MDANARINYKHLFQQTVEAIPWPTLIIDAHLHIFHSNRALRELMGVESLPKTRLLDQLLDDTAIVHLVQACIQTGTSYSGEFSRAKRTWKVSIRPIERLRIDHHEPQTATQKAAEGGPTAYQYFAVVIEDLTELRRLERIRSDFLVNISHELRTPLTSVRLLAETLEDVIETDPEKAQVFVERIENEVQYLNDLVAELLELSRIESGQVPMSIEPVGAEMLVREVMARLLPQAQRHRVTLRTQIEQGSTKVAADSKQIARVLVNLVHNAIKFTPSGGLIVIGTRRQPDEVTQSFFVRDTGVGIAPEDLPRVFERFYKVSQSRSRANFTGPGGGGSGLGLAIARHVVEAHGGRISATSVLEQGSTFTFTLPMIISEENVQNK